VTIMYMLHISFCMQNKLASATMPVRLALISCAPCMTAQAGMAAGQRLMGTVTTLTLEPLPAEVG
jgi:hypothetical protein